jgi:hypothetical protein
MFPSFSRRRGLLENSQRKSLFVTKTDRIIGAGTERGNPVEDQPLVKPDGFVLFSGRVGKVQSAAFPL